MGRGLNGLSQAIQSNILTCLYDADVVCVNAKNTYIFQK